MRKDILTTILLGSLSTGVYAGGDIGGVITFENTDSVMAEVESVEPLVIPKKIEPKKIVEPIKRVEPKNLEPKVIKEVKKEEPKKEKDGFYTVIKGNYNTGDDVDTFSTDSGYGVGLDIGYSFGNGLAVELGLGYDQNQLDNIATENDVAYTSAGLSLAYTYNITKAVGVFAKVGYGMEKTDIDDDATLTYDDSDSGVIYGAGLEYKISDTYGLVAEYEGTTMDSLRGNIVGLGLKYNF
ncbi:MAG: porin family protein [Sulfurovaceae bacterium]|nr:porin family protein [Sulfurovaceae bacterium]